MHGLTPTIQDFVPISTRRNLGIIPIGGCDLGILLLKVLGTRPWPRGMEIYGDP